MVDTAQLSQINQLVGEYRSNAAAIAAFDAGERISMMAIGGVAITTQGWDYPPPMVTSIKGILEARNTTIRADLAGLGFTGDPARPSQPDDEEVEAVQAGQAAPASPTAQAAQARAAAAAARAAAPPVPPRPPVPPTPPPRGPLHRRGV